MFVLLGLFVTALVLRLAFLDATYFFWDESVYLLHGMLFSGQHAGYSETFLRPPLLPLLLAPLAKFPQHYELLARLLAAFLSSLIVVPAFFLTKELFGKKSALMASVVVVLLPVHILNSRWIMTDSPAALLMLSSVAVFLVGLRADSASACRFLAACAGALAALAVLMKFTGLLVLALLLPVFAAYLLQGRILPAVLSSLAFAAAVMPYLAYNALAFGSPFSAFQRAFHVVATPDPAGFGFFFSLLIDSLGMLLLFLLLGLFCLALGLRKSLGFRRLYLLFCIFLTGAFSFFMLGRGVAKPVGIEWEAARFMLPFLLFSLPLVGFGIAAAASYFRQLGRFGLFASVLLVILVTASVYPQFVRSYTPAISYEGGLRHATKEIGLYLNANPVQGLGCIGNCPPVAYYSRTGRMDVYYSTDELLNINHAYVVAFDSTAEALASAGGFRTAQDFCVEKHCAYLLKRTTN